MRIAGYLTRRWVLGMLVSTFGVEAAARTPEEPDISGARNATYEQVCGECHMAFQPGLLPSRSWSKLLEGLSQHFGETLGLDPAVIAEIGAYLNDQAAERNPSKISQRLLASLGWKETPLRITSIRYFAERHEEILASMGPDNPDVKSMANCGACHPRANSGYYLESEVAIPGFGRWQQFILHPEPSDY